MTQSQKIYQNSYGRNLANFGSYLAEIFFNLLDHDHVLDIMPDRHMQY